MLFVSMGPTLRAYSLPPCFKSLINPKKSAEENKTKKLEQQIFSVKK